VDTYLECPLRENDALLSACLDGQDRTLTKLPRAAREGDKCAYKGQGNLKWN